MGMAWCRASSLTAAVSRSLEGARFPMTRSRVLASASGKVLEGWEIDYFLSKALSRKNYSNIKEVLSDLDDWLESQG